MSAPCVEGVVRETPQAAERANAGPACRTAPGLCPSREPGRGSQARPPASFSPSTWASSSPHDEAQPAPVVAPGPAPFAPLRPYRRADEIERELPLLGEADELPVVAEMTLV